jgi:outer membrane protein insertion porin family
MDHLDTTSDKSRNSRLVKRALGAASKNQARLALTCVLATTLPIGMGTLVANAASVSHQTVTGVKSTFSSESTTTKKPLLLAAVAEDNQPTAAPQENQPALAVPLKPDKSPQPDPHLPPAEPGGTEVSPVPPVTPPPSVPSEPPAASVSPYLNPAQAEGMEIANVRVAGNRVVPNDSILLQISGTKPGARFSIRQAEADRLSILGLGFFASAQYQITPNLNDPSKIDVVFVVVENRVVTGFRIEGNKLVKSEDVIAALVSQKGAVLNSQNVAKDSKAIQDLYRQHGYAALVSDVRQEDDGTTVFVIQEGKVSRIEIAGLKKTNESIVRGLIATKPGDPFNEKKLQKDLNRIYDTGFFEDVTYKINDDPDHPGALVITIVVKEKRTGQLSLGVGFDNRSKISGYVSVGDNNFRGTGRSISGEVQLGSVKSFQVSVGDRFVGKNNASYNVSIYSTTTYLEPKTVNLVTGNPTTFNYQQQRTGGRINYTLPLDFDHTTNILFGYRNEKVKLFQYDNNNDLTDVPFNDSDGRISAFSLGYLHDNRDLRLDPSNGGREQVIVERGFSFLGGNTNFTKLDVDLRHYIPLMKPEKKGDLPKLVLAGRIVYGHTLGNLPPFEQYFIGGSDTVRGYETDAQFGDNQIYGNLELRYRVNKKFQFVAFSDAGSAYGGNNSPYTNIDLLFSVGVGIRLQTPIGPIRLDVGKGTDGMKTSFGIGPTF